MNTLQSQWQSFERAVMPAGAPPVQRQEMRRAFYAGAQAFFGLMTGELCDRSEDAGIGMIEGWRQELKAFAADVEAGRA